MAYKEGTQKHERNGKHSAQHFLVAHVVVRVNCQHFADEGCNDRFHEVNLTRPELQINEVFLQAHTVFST